MSRAQRQKGKRGELLWRDMLRAHGFEAQRAGFKQAHLGSGGADVEDNSGFWWEVKFVEKLNVRQAYEQAAAACPLATAPAVAHKTSAKIWLATLAGEDLLRILRKLHDAERRLAEADNGQQAAPAVEKTSGN
jgi:hypothetical protein